MSHASSVTNPRIPIFSPDSVIFYPSGTLKTPNYAHTQTLFGGDSSRRCIAIIKPDKIKKPMQALEAEISSAHFRRNFCNVESFESFAANISRQNELAAEEEAQPSGTVLPGIPTTSATKTKTDQLDKKQIFLHVFSATEDEFNLYEKAGSVESKREVLQTIYDRHAIALLQNADLEKTVNGFCKNRTFLSETKRKLLCKPVETLMNRAEESLLTIAQDAGLVVFAADAERNKMAKEGSSAYYSPATTDITVTNAVFKKEFNQNGLDYGLRVVTEELLHLADFKLGITESVEWQKAFKKDYLPDMTTASDFIDTFNLMSNKTRLSVQSEYSRSTEIFPDLFNLDMNYDWMLEQVKKYAETPTTSKSSDTLSESEVKEKRRELYAKKIQKLLFDDSGNPKPKEEVMTTILPTLWPLYRESIEKIKSHAAEISAHQNDGAEQTWVESIRRAVNNQVGPT